MLNTQLPVIGFAAFSGTGKTTLLKQVIPLLRAQGLRPGLIKHAHHQVEFDKPGKDSYELRKAGAGQVLLASANRWALMAEESETSEPELPVLLTRMDLSVLDLVLVEGFRHLSFPKIELHRPSLGKPLLFEQDDSIIAIASDEPISHPCELPQLDLNDPPAIAEFIRHYCASASA
ncbi:MAG: molybdopterin-guanine dinucleotide biosynthesis protein B [Candidatus Thiodiazotropha sp. (ex Myrtea spinifera)]|nr:molybdopterin-guanine dinucleotide biosynthesis protein B [Candidatus Thiodiazotropha sp. (ex Myrtea spinifera)]